MRHAPNGATNEQANPARERSRSPAAHISDAPPSHAPRTQDDAVGGDTSAGAAGDDADEAEHDGEFSEDSFSEDSSLHDSDIEGLSRGELLHVAFFHDLPEDHDDMSDLLGDLLDPCDDDLGGHALQDADLQGTALWESDAQDEERLTHDIRERVLPTLLAVTAGVREAWLRSQGVCSLRAFAALLSEHGGVAAVQRKRGSIVLQHVKNMQIWVDMARRAHVHAEAARDAEPADVQPPSWNTLVAEHIHQCAPHARSALPRLDSPFCACLLLGQVLLILGRLRVVQRSASRSCSSFQAHATDLTVHMACAQGHQGRHKMRTGALDRPGHDGSAAL